MDHRLDMASPHLRRLGTFLGIVSLSFAWDFISQGVTAAEKPEIKASHTPKQPKSGEPVTNKAIPPTIMVIPCPISRPSDS